MDPALHPELYEFSSLLGLSEANKASFSVERDDVVRVDTLRREQVHSGAAWGSTSARIGITSDTEENGGRARSAWAAKPVALADSIAQLGLDAAHLHMVLIADVPESDEALYLPMHRFIIGHLIIAGRPVLARMTFLGETMDVEVDLRVDAKSLSDIEREVLSVDVPAAHGLQLHDLAYLFGNEHDPHSDLEWLPEALQKPDLLSLDAIRLTIDPDDDKWLVSMGATLGFLGDTQWPLIPGFDFLTVTGLHADLDVEHPLDAGARFPNVGLGGTLVLGEAELEIKARWPDMAVQGQLRAAEEHSAQDGASHPVELGALFEAVGIPALGVAKISQLGFEARPTSVQPTFALWGRLDDALSFEVGSSTLELRSVDARLALTRGRRKTVGARIEGELGIGKHGVRMYAETVPGDQGWGLRGWLVGDPIELTELDTWIGDRFGAHPFPQSLLASANPRITDLEVSFHTATHDVSFGLGTAFNLTDDIEATMHLDLALAHHGGGHFERSIGGRFEVGDEDNRHVFDLLLAQDGESGEGEGAEATDPTNVLVAAYRHDGTATVGDLLAAVGLDLPVPIELSKALLARSGGETLCAVDVGVGFNLSSLPFVGTMFPGAPSLTLDLRVIVPSGGWDTARVDALNGHLPGGYAPLSLPEGDEGTDAVLQPTLVVNLGMGDIQQSLDLGLGLDAADARGGAPPAANTLPVATAAADPDAGVQWVPVQKKLGPVYFRRIGARYNAEDRSIELLLDGDVGLGGLTLSLDGLAVKTPLEADGNTGFHPSFSLRGLGLEMKQGPLRVGGAFLKISEDEFAGSALLETDALALSAIGAYGNFGGNPSMFLYAVLDYPLGGPSFFFVTGLAVGFGYNRKLVMPAPEAIGDFPLVKEAVAGASGAALPTGDGLMTKLSSLSRHIPYSRGDYFLAVGIKFNSFKVVDSFALLIASFGEKFRLDVLGESTLVSPPREAGVNTPPLAEIRMAFRAQFVPDEGFLGLDARVAPGSYVLSKDCHISGGYAFYSWFSGQHAGDFVVTLGGYHPKFKVPAHYPKPPRAKIQWQVSKHVAIKGELYYALTGRAMMCGGKLSATYTNGSVGAWFNATADFLMAWKPFSYDARISVSVGARWKSLRAEVGADVHLWGPEFSGKAKISWWFVSFTVKFGSGVRPTAKFLENWGAFARSFLPEQPLSIACTSGLIGTVKSKDSPPGRDSTADEWAVSGHGLVLSVTNQVPATEVSINDGDPQNAAGADKVGIAPMNVLPGALNAPLSVTITSLDGSEVPHVVAEPVLKNVPSALWGKPNPSPSLGNLGDALVEGVVGGLTLRLGEEPELAPAVEFTCEYNESKHPAHRQHGGVRRLSELTDPEASAGDVGPKERAEARVAVLLGLGLDPAQARSTTGRDGMFRSVPTPVSVSGLP